MHAQDIVLIFCQSSILVHNAHDGRTKRHAQEQSAEVPHSGQNGCGDDNMLGTHTIHQSSTGNDNGFFSTGDHSLHYLTPPTLPNP